MQNAVNKRIIQLKEDLDLTDIEFCGRASISTGTLHRIKNDEEVSKKILNSITNAFNVNKDWLLNGDGPKFNDNPKDPAPGAPSPEEALWQNATFVSLQEQIKMLKQLVNHLSKGELNFHEPLDEPGAVIVAINEPAYLKASAA